MEFHLGTRGDRGMPIMDWYDVGRLTYVSSIAGRPQVAGRHQARSSEGPILCRQAALSRHFTYPGRAGLQIAAEQARFHQKGKRGQPKPNYGSTSKPTNMIMDYAPQAEVYSKPQRKMQNNENRVWDWTCCSLHALSLWKAKRME